MGYKVFTVNENSQLKIRSNTDGYQPKFIVDNGKYFVKTQCQIGGTLRDDWRVEDIASRICEQLGIYAVKQVPCYVKIISKKGITKTRLGVYSNNFEQDGYSFISYQRLMEFNNLEESQIGFEKLSATDKLKYLINSMTNLSGIAKPRIVRYFFDMVTVDLLVLNQDRHFRNFGVFSGLNSGMYDVSRLFDFGMGLFEDNTTFDSLKTLKECMRFSYISPYGEDPFEMLNQLKGIKIYRDYLRSLHVERLKISKELFIHPASYQYFSKMRSEMCRV